MNPNDEQIARIRELEQSFLQKVETLRSQYQADIKTILKGIEERKLAEIRKSLEK